MQEIDRLRVNTFRFFVIFSFITAYFSLLYINYNLPIFKQIFAHHYFESVTVSYKKQNDIDCMAVSCKYGSSIYAPNKMLCSGHTRKTGYSYNMSGMSYDVLAMSYINPANGCPSDQLAQAYYYSAIPSWSVLDNRLPGGDYKNSFEHTTYAMMSLAILFVVITILSTIINYRNSQSVGIIQIWKFDYKVKAFLHAILLPYVLTAVYVLLVNEGFLSSFNHVSLWELLLFLIIVYAPSTFLIFTILPQKLLYYLLLPIAPAALLFTQRLIEGGLLSVLSSFSELFSLDL